MSPAETAAAWIMEPGNASGRPALSKGERLWLLVVRSGAPRAVAWVSAREQPGRDWLGVDWRPEWDGAGVIGGACLSAATVTHQLAAVIGAALSPRGVA